MTRKTVFIIFFLLFLNFLMFSQNNKDKSDAVTSASEKIPDYFNPDSSIKEVEKKITEVEKEGEKPEEIFKEGKKEVSVVTEKEDAKKESEIIVKKEMTDSTTRASDKIPQDELEYLLNKTSIKEQKQKELEKFKKLEADKKKQEELVLEKKFEEEKVLKEKEAKEEKKEIKTPEIKDLTSDIIASVDYTKRKSNMIIFNEKNDVKPPSVKDYTDEQSLTSLNPWYRSENFIPENIKDFFLAQPDFIYDNNVIKKGKKTITSKLGEKAFAVSYDFYLNNDYKNAINSFERLVYYNYRVPESSYYLAWCHFVLRNYDTAIIYMNNAIVEAEKLGYENSIISEYLHQTGNYYLVLKDYGSAIKFYTQSIQKNSSYYKNYEKLGLCYYYLNDYKKALEYWKIGMDNNDLNSANNHKWLTEKLK
ncbi:MAG: tetratricopeptide repeat protein [Spirochaetes bacterium]|nr:tetratricopeptide repeat protein [Spirochaetota bacterium]